MAWLPFQKAKMAKLFEISGGWKYEWKLDRLKGLLRAVQKIVFNF